MSAAEGPAEMEIIGVIRARGSCSRVTTTSAVGHFGVNPIETLVRRSKQCFGVYLWILRIRISN
jgi:hypothetical protein